MQSLGILNFLVILNLVNLTNKIWSFDNLGTDSAGAGAPATSRPWGCSYRAGAGAGAGASTIAGANITGSNTGPDTYVVNFGADNSASSGFAKDGDSFSPRRTPSPIDTKTFVDATGVVQGLSAYLADLVGANRDAGWERKPELAETRAGGASGTIWPRVTRAGLVRPGAASRTRKAPGEVGALAPVPLTRLDTISEISSVVDVTLPASVREVRARSDSSPRISADPLNSAVLRLAITLEQSSHVAAQAHAAERDRELAEKAAYARRPWYRRAEARAECSNFTAVVCSAAASAAAIAALYYQNNHHG
jgi:hypothetical protein